MSRTETQNMRSRLTAPRAVENRQDVLKRGGDAISGEHSSECCENDEHEWADIGVLCEDDRIGDEDMKVWDKTLILQRCMKCRRKRVVEEGEEEDLSSELDGTMLAYVESHPDLQRW